MKRKAMVVCLMVAAMLPAYGGRRDPLNAKEVAQMREAAQEPKKRIELLIEFANARMLAMDQLRADPNVSEQRPQQIHDLLEDFAAIVDELDDNVDYYNRQRADLRKPLKKAIEAATAWQLKLRSIRAAAAQDAQLQAELKEYDFVLETATDSVHAVLDASRDLLEEQNRSAERKKKR